MWLIYKWYWHCLISANLHMLNIVSPYNRVFVPDAYCSSMTIDQLNKEYPYPNPCITDNVVTTSIITLIDWLQSQVAHFRSQFTCYKLTSSLSGRLCKSSNNGIWDLIRRPLRQYCTFCTDPHPILCLLVSVLFCADLKKVKCDKLISNGFNFVYYFTYCLFKAGLTVVNYIIYIMLYSMVYMCRNKLELKHCYLLS